MARRTVVTLLFILLSVSAFGKAHNDTYPIPCGDLWAAVMDALGNAGNYTVMASDDSGMTATYLIVGSQRQRINSVLLTAKDAGCRMQVNAPDSGNSNDDEGLFRKRVDHSLAKLQTAKPSVPAKPSGGN